MVCPPGRAACGGGRSSWLGRRGSMGFGSGSGVRPPSFALCVRSSSLVVGSVLVDVELVVVVVLAAVLPTLLPLRVLCFIRWLRLQLLLLLVFRLVR